LSEVGSTVLRRNPKIEEAPLERELMLFDPESSRFYVLNRTMASIWKGCDGQTRPDAIVERLVRDFDGVEPSTAEADVRAALEDLVSKGLLVDSSPKSP